MRFPLQISIAAVFTLLIVLLGATLIGFSYTKNKEVALLAAEDAFARITRETQNNIQGMYRPAEALVDLTIRLPAAEAPEPAQDRPPRARIRRAQWPLPGDSGISLFQWLGRLRH